MFLSIGLISNSLPTWLFYWRYLSNLTYTNRHKKINLSQHKSNVNGIATSYEQLGFDILQQQIITKWTSKQ